MARTNGNQAGASLERVAVVAIGRNEGERLRRCLEAARNFVGAVAYVDSGSEDQSVEVAHSLGVLVSELDPSVPYTHARARNLGIRTLLAAHPETELIQILDGDCELVEGWLEAAVETLRGDAEVSWVCGRVRERFPEASIYNRLRALEWEFPQPGTVTGSSSNGLTRVSTLEQVGGFTDEMIAGADLEICFRMRQAGGRIVQLDADMCWHDSAMTHFSQWWRRNLRAGHVYAEGVWRHGRSRYHLREFVANLVWALGLPLVTAVLFMPTHGWSLALLALVPLKVVQIALGLRRRGYAHADAWLYAASCLADKLPQSLGQLFFLMKNARRRDHVLIEYK